MISNAEEHYTKIGQCIFDKIPHDFEIAYARVEMLDDVGSLGVFYETSEGRYVYINEGISDLFNIFRDLRDGFKSELGYTWTTATFRIDKIGRMSIDIGYEDISDFGLAPERRKEWIKKYLGESPVIDWGG